MKLLECYVENFGKLTSYSYAFTDGLNVIAADNGYGKTTLSVFIKSMLYGIDSKKSKSEENERKRYLPWQGGRCGGSLSFEANGKRYRIERTFGERASSDSFAIYNADTGAPTSDFSENVGAELFGIDADGFERTVFLSEKKFSVKNNNQTISAKLSNLVGVDGDMGNFDGAVEMLEKKEKFYRHRRGGGGLIGEIKSELSALDAEIYGLNRKKDEYANAEKELRAIQNRIGDAEENKKTIDAKRLGGAYKREYRAKIEALASYEEKLDTEKAFFHNKSVSPTRIREFEEKHNRLKLLREESSKESQISTDLLRAEMNEVDEHITTYKMSENTDYVNKRYHLWFVLAISIAVLGLILGAVLSPILFVAVLLSAPFIYLGIKVKNAVSENERSAHLLLTPALDFVLEKTGRAANKDNLYIALLEIKANISSKIKEAEKSLRRKEAVLEEINLAEKECSAFLSDFSISTNDPFGEIRAHLALYEMLLSEITSRKRDAELYAREHSLSAKEAEITAESDEADEAALSAIESELKAAREAYYATESKCMSLSDDISREDELNERKLELSDSLKSAEQTHKLIIKATEHLTAAKERLTEKYLGKMRSAFDFYINAMASESGKLFAIDSDFALRKTENGLTNPSESYSLGTRELYALATRFALTDVLYEKNSPFVILDDPFCHFDDKKCEAALKAISFAANERQIIYLTCSESRTPK